MSAMAPAGDNTCSSTPKRMLLIPSSSPLSPADSPFPLSPSAESPRASSRLSSSPDLSAQLVTSRLSSPMLLPSSPLSHADSPLPLSPFAQSPKASPRLSSSPLSTRLVTSRLSLMAKSSPLCEQLDEYMFGDEEELFVSARRTLQFSPSPPTRSTSHDELPLTSMVPARRLMRPLSFGRNGAVSPYFNALFRKASFELINVLSNRVLCALFFSLMLLISVSAYSLLTSSTRDFAQFQDPAYGLTCQFGGLFALVVIGMYVLFRFCCKPNNLLFNLFLAGVGAISSLFTGVLFVPWITAGARKLYKLYNVKV